MKRTLALLMITAVISLGSIQPAIAAKSLTKTYKVTVTLPEMVGINSQELSSKAKVKTYTLMDPRIYTEETAIVRNNEKMILRTVVVQ